MKSQEYKDYREELKAIGPVVSEAQAKQYGIVWEKYHKVNIFTGEEIKDKK